MSTILQQMANLGLAPTRLVSDSRQVQTGDTFIAYPGEAVDGRHFIAQAIENGASSVVWDEDDFSWNVQHHTPNFAVHNLREQVGEIASEFYGEPSQKLWVIGVTGTNGKTSCSHWLAQALNHLGRKTAVIGTLGNGFPENLTKAINTTPDPILLQRSLANYLTAGANSIAMEVSSHALVQGRVNGMKFDVALLTNLSRDHLDFHGDMNAYAAAKRILFTWPNLQTAVLNADDAFGASLASELDAVKVLTYGFNQADVCGSKLKLSDTGLSMKVTTPQGQTELQANVLGRFNAYNLLAVLAALLASDVDLQDAVKALAQVKSVTGRMQTLGGGDLPLVVVDYAHTPDALEKVLNTLREQCRGQLVCVFGCGGNRDQGKRPLMGKTASDLADFTIVTSDNPRQEDPLAIIGQVVKGVQGQHRIETDRATAIRFAINMANSGDIVLLAGKGHEDTQHIGDTLFPFNDALIASHALNSKDAT
ncbi:MAG: UDP-N-acetylmuramoyl-L-alanyl-D-glutamate--2,6-diaminopimelate ligase [Methylophilales bacterium]|nr:UDP-N-acetylmuramoyl-L-alanyl-D-glutamate--2,6-diaminopimelate ligase [Methylophilales bacterium]